MMACTVDSSNFVEIDDRRFAQDSLEIHYLLLKNRKKYYQLRILTAY